LRQVEALRERVEVLTVTVDPGLQLVRERAEGVASDELCGLV